MLRITTLVLAALAALSTSAVPAAADDLVVPVADLVTEAQNGDSLDTLDGAMLGDAFFFRAHHPLYGTELWMSDGTPEGTRLFLDVCRGPCGSRLSGFEVAGDRLYLVADDGVAFGRELWVSDGTRAGTHVALDVCPGACDGVTGDWLAALGDRVFFTADDGRGGGLWSSDGERLADLGGWAVVDSAAGQEVLYVLTADDDLWVTDGTPFGTRRLLDDCLGCELLGVLHERLLFRRQDVFADVEPWTIGPTGARPERLGDLCPDGCASFPHGAVRRGDLLYFIARGPDRRVTLFRTDGTAAGTAPVEPPPTLGGGFAGASDLVLWGGDLYFFVTQAGAPTFDLWRSDGTAAGSRRLGRLPRGPAMPVAGEDHLFFVARSHDGRSLELRATDGTDTGEILATFPIAEARTLTGLTPVAEGIFFAGYDLRAGFEPWVSDGTAAGTHLLRDLDHDAGSSSPRVLAEVRGHLVFVAGRGDETAIRRADGPGTAEPLGAGPPSTDAFGRLGDVLVYAADRVGLSHGDDRRGLWRTDGTPEGTTRIAAEIDGAHRFVESGDRLFFSAYDFLAGEELWVSDGTPEGSRLVADLNPGFEPSVLLPCCPNSAIPREILAAAGGVFFAAATEPFDGDVELWWSNGSEERTWRVMDLCPGSCGSDPRDLTVWDGRLVFGADDGESGREPWTSTGTEAGTRRLADLVPGAPGSDPHGFTALGERLVFFAMGEGGGERLWAQDPGGAGPFEVLDLAVDGLPSWVGEVEVVGERLFFVAANLATGAELWTTDGTAEGTRLVRDVLPGPAGSAPSDLTAVDGLLLFAADDGEHGVELWASVGSAAGTVRLADLEPGFGSSRPAEITVAGPRVYLSATTTETGREPWSIERRDLAVWRQVLRLRGAAEDVP